jgi:hypothetical protein
MSAFGGKVVKKIEIKKDGRSKKTLCAFGCGAESGPQGYGNHVKAKHPEEFKIGLRITGLKNPGLWTKQTVADIRAVQRADRQEKETKDEYLSDHELAHTHHAPLAALEVTPGCGTRVEDQVEELVRDLNIAETQQVFYTVLHLKIEAEQERLRAVLDTLRPQF